jgi:hypothetical protein
MEIMNEVQLLTGGPSSQGWSAPSSSSSSASTAPSPSNTNSSRSPSTSSSRDHDDDDYFYYSSPNLHQSHGAGKVDFAHQYHHCSDSNASSTLNANVAMGQRSLSSEGNGTHGKHNHCSTNHVLLGASTPTTNELNDSGSSIAINRLSYSTGNIYDPPSGIPRCFNAPLTVRL